MFILFSFHAVSMWVYSEFDRTVLLMSLAWAVIGEMALPLHKNFGMQVYVPFMVAMQVLVLMVSWFIQAQDVSNVTYWTEGTELHVLPFGWTIHSTMGAVVVAAGIAWFATIVAVGPDMPKELHEA